MIRTSPGLRWNQKISSRSTITAPMPMLKKALTLVYQGFSCTTFSSCGDSSDITRSKMLITLVLRFGRVIPFFFALFLAYSLNLSTCFAFQGLMDASLSPGSCKIVFLHLPPISTHLLHLGIGRLGLIGFTSFPIYLHIIL